MTITIQHSEVDALLQELQAVTGKNGTEIVVDLLREEVARRRRLRSVEERRQRIEAICQNAQARMTGPLQPHEEIIGYDQYGLPQ